jgi:uncharacterized protein YozE (UPF0346 family)
MKRERNPGAPTDLGRALRDRDAYLRSGWEKNYRGAIEATHAGDTSRLIDLLHAHRPLNNDDFDKLADYLETKGKRGRNRLVDLLRARKPLDDDDFDKIAGYVGTTAKRRRGRSRNEAVHKAARLAETIMKMHKGRVPNEHRTASIKAACDQIKREIGEPVDQEAVRDLLNRPRKRRQKSTI